MGAKRDFLIFCTRLQYHKDLKLTAIIAFGKNFVLKVLGQNGPKMKFFR